MLNEIFADAESDLQVEAAAERAERKEQPRLVAASFTGFGNIQMANVEFDPASSVVRLAGPIGAGKTTFIEGILWCLLGSAGVSGRVIGDYTDLARVVLTFSNGRWQCERTQLDDPANPGKVKNALRIIRNGKGKAATQKDLEIEFWNELSFPLTDLRKMEKAPRVALFLKLFVPDYDLASDVQRLKEIGAQLTAANATLEERQSQLKAYADLKPERPATVDVKVALETKRDLEERRRQVDAIQVVINGSAGRVAEATRQIAEYNTSIEQIRAEEAQAEKDTEAEILRLKQVLEAETKRLQQVLADQKTQNAQRIKTREDEISYRETKIKDQPKVIADHELEIATLKGEMDLPAEIQKLDNLVSAAQITDRAATRWDEGQTAQKAVDVASEQVATLQANRAAVAKAKAEALAEANIPVKDLTFDENDVLFRGRPLEDASDGEMATINTRIGIVQHEQGGGLGMVRIDANDLDEYSLQDVVSAATAAGKLVFIHETTTPAPDEPMELTITEGVLKADIQTRPYGS